MNKKILFICHAAMIAALYVVLTLVASSIDLASGNIQLRFSEALTILPFFTPAAIPGLTIGCLISNLIAGCVPLDILFGTFATLLGALGSYALRRYKWLVPLPPILSNSLIVPWVLRLGYGMPLSIPFMMLTVGIGEILSCYVLGMILLLALEKSGSAFFHNQN